MNIFKVLVFLAVFSPVASMAGTYQGGLLIDRVWVESNKVVFGFTSKPSDCVDSQGYYWTHAYINGSNPLFKEQLSLLLLARASGKKVDIWYEDQGDCTTATNLLSVSIIGIAQGE